MRWLLWGTEWAESLCTPNRTLGNYLVSLGLWRLTCNMTPAPGLAQNRGSTSDSYCY